MMKELYRRGVSISEIARRTGHDRKTVRAALSRPVLAPRRSPPPRPSKLDPYTDYLERRIGEGVLNAQKLFREVRALGYSGKRTLVRSFVHPLRPAREPMATVRFETEPGEQAQVDWAHFGTIEHQGRPRKLYAFLCTLGWSRALHLEFTVSMQSVAFLRCHVHAFRALGGVPRRILYDNLKSVVLDRGRGPGGGSVHWNPAFLDFADYYGFAPQPCRPYRAQTKGKVERGVGYVRGDFWQGMHQGTTFTDLDDLNRQARDWTEVVANRRVHGTTGAIPAERLPHEGLQPLTGKPDYDTSLVCYRRSTRDCLVSYSGTLYSVPAAYAGQQLLVRETEHEEVAILGPHGEEIARHRLATGAGGAHQRVVVPSHYAALHLGDWVTIPPTTPATTSAAPVPATTVLPDAPLVEVRTLAEYDRLLGVAL